MPIAPAAAPRCLTRLARQPAMATIGASVSAIDAGQFEIMPPFSAHLTQQHGNIHARITAMIADTACGFAARSLMPEDAAALTTQFKLNRLASAKGERLNAVGRVVQPGKTLMVCPAEVVAEDAGKRKQVALMTASNGGRHGHGVA
jgi:uncharacterized protein (TIGR00369 family)